MGVSALLDFVCVSVASAPGTSTTISLGGVVTGAGLTFAGAGAVNGGVYAYTIFDGPNQEDCYGTFNSGANTITRTTRLASVNSVAQFTPINASANAVIVTRLQPYDVVTQSLLAPQCGILQLSSATQIVFNPCNGCFYKCGGQIYQIPSSGITANNTSVRVNGTAGQNLAATTGYYVSVNAGGVIGFWAATTYSHMPDTTAGNVGTEVTSSSGTPNSAETLIGYVYTDGSADFEDSSSFRGLLSWFNRGDKEFNQSTGNLSTTTTVLQRLSTGIYVATWGTEAIEAWLYGQCYNDTSGQYGLIMPVYDTTAGHIGSGTYCFYVSAATPYIPFAVGASATIPEGAHVLYLAAGSTSGSGHVYITNSALTGKIRG